MSEKFRHFPHHARDASRSPTSTGRRVSQVSRLRAHAAQYRRQAGRARGRTRSSCNAACRGEPVNCIALLRVEAKFVGRPPLDLVACARLLSRAHAAHAAHALDLGARRVSPIAEAKHGRRLDRVQGLDQL